MLVTDALWSMGLLQFLNALAQSVETTGFLLTNAAQTAILAPNANELESVGMRTWIKQKPKTRCCGHIAVAVIAGITLEASKKLIHKRGGTTTKNLVTALRKLGFKCPDRCRKMPRPPLGIGQLKKPTRKRGWHWIVVDGDRIYDGIHGNPDGTVNWEADWKITSYLPVEFP